MSFYISIPDIHNGELTIHLGDPINLPPGKWKVALVEAFFPSKLATIQIGERICTISNGSEIDTYTATTDFYFNNVSEIVNFLHDEILSKSSMDIAYIDTEVIMKSRTLDQWVDFGDRVGNILGFESGVRLNTANSTEADICGGVYNLYIYSNTITPQYVGDTRTNLLKTIYIDKTSDNTHVIFENPYYLDISHNYLSHIQLDIRSLTSAKIKFPSGFRNFILHFKQVM